MFSSLAFKNSSSRLVSHPFTTSIVELDMAPVEEPATLDMIDKRVTRMDEFRKNFFWGMEHIYEKSIVAQIDLTHQLISYATDLICFTILHIKKVLIFEIVMRLGFRSIYISGDKREEYSRYFINTCKR